MKSAVLPKDIIQTYKNRFIEENSMGLVKKGGSECILFCKKVTPNIFNIKDGFAVVSGAEDAYNDGVCMISNFTKVVFVFEKA